MSDKRTKYLPSFVLLSALLLTSPALVRAGDDQGTILDDGALCAAVRNDDFDRLTFNLMKYHQTILKESYFRIQCGENDILQMVIENPIDRISVAFDLQDYFEDEGLPEVFSQVLMNKVQGQAALKRIEIALTSVRGNPAVAGTEYEKILVKLQDWYIEHLEKYPVQGSAEAVVSAKASLEK